ncbi:hypothetical protein EGW08_008831 [Elysia chlorotica]|uniref:Secondary thiamine-phosphate synthase enzyme n=1 Tax=Elysia chlorotica TaxID=188477 RepID=A0A433TPF7_ELYCH|nr:hypothetical protein EGW08_008831 [Elysia chlorotica]
MASGGEGVTVWYQREVPLKSRSRGCHYITDEIDKACAEELNKIKVGVANIHIMFFINDNDPGYNFMVNIFLFFFRKDMEMVLNKVVPESWNYKHSLEGPDDMPAHAKAAMMGSSLSIPITNGKFNLGTWQGVWLCEHRDSGGSRKLIVTMNGLKK